MSLYTPLCHILARIAVAPLLFEDANYDPQETMKNHVPSVPRHRTASPPKSCLRRPCAQTFAVVSDLTSSGCTSPDSSSSGSPPPSSPSPYPRTVRRVTIGARVEHRLQPLDRNTRDDFYRFNWSAEDKAEAEEDLHYLAIHPVIPKENLTKENEEYGQKIREELNKKKALASRARKDQRIIEGAIQDRKAAQSQQQKHTSEGRRIHVLPELPVRMTFVPIFEPVPEELPTTHTADVAYMKAIAPPPGLPATPMFAPPSESRSRPNWLQETAAEDQSSSAASSPISIEDLTDLAPRPPRSPPPPPPPTPENPVAPRYRQWVNVNGDVDMDDPYEFYNLANAEDEDEEMEDVY